MKNLFRSLKFLVNKQYKILFNSDVLINARKCNPLQQK
jgi:hypothetical protein